MKMQIDNCSDLFNIDGVEQLGNYLDNTLSLKTKMDLIHSTDVDVFLRNNNEIQFMGYFRFIRASEDRVQLKSDLLLMKQFIEKIDIGKDLCEFILSAYEVYDRAVTFLANTNVILEKNMRNHVQFRESATIAILYQALSKRFNCYITEHSKMIVFPEMNTAVFFSREPDYTIEKNDYIAVGNFTYEEPEIFVRNLLNNTEFIPALMEFQLPSLFRERNDYDYSYGYFKSIPDAKEQIGKLLTEEEIDFLEHTSIQVYVNFKDNLELKEDGYFVTLDSSLLEYKCLCLKTPGFIIRVVDRRIEVFRDRENVISISERPNF